MEIIKYIKLFVVSFFRIKKLAIAFIALITICALNSSLLAQKRNIKMVLPENIPNLLCFWDFQESTNDYLVSKGKYAYRLNEMNGNIAHVKEGIFGPSSLEIKKGQWLMIKRDDCPGLNIHGNQAVTVVAWINRKVDGNWQYIAGMWNERDAKRQYALFTCGHKQTDYTTLERIDAQFQTHGYVSDVGGATPNRPYCFSYATGRAKINLNQWYMIAFTYDHKSLKVFFNGELDENGNYNPFFWEKPIFDGGKDGADFTIAQRALPAWPGYPIEVVPTHNEGFGGLLAGVAIYDRALNVDEVMGLYKSTMKHIFKEGK